MGFLEPYGENVLVFLSNFQNYLSQVRTLLRDRKGLSFEILTYRLGDMWSICHLVHV